MGGFQTSPNGRFGVIPEAVKSHLGQAILQGHCMLCPEAHVRPKERADAVAEGRRKQ